MDLIDTINISSSGLAAQRVRLQTIASNLANARTTRAGGAAPYKRKVPVIQARALDAFGSQLDQALATAEVTEIRSVGGERLVHDPSHPDADAQGWVRYPDINMLHEMVDLMTTSRSYEANANVLSATKEMGMRALEIGR